MPIPRKQQISLSDTPFYHCISRCVRRTFLCGMDTVTHKDYSHRKQWIVERLALLSSTLAIEVCAYAIMSNHCHTVLKINAPLAQSWSDKEVIQRWEQLFSLPVLVERYLSGQCQSDAEKNKVRETISLFRERLMDIIWFMRCLNEHVARKANTEDQCTGRFWEGRFKSQALLDEQAILCCIKLQLDKQTWMDTVQGLSKGFYSFIGPEQQLKSLCRKQNRHWVRGINACRKLFNLKQSCPLPV